jgi:hypothetical protein
MSCGTSFPDQPDQFRWIMDSQSIQVRFPASITSSSTCFFDFFHDFPRCGLVNPSVGHELV